MENLWKEAFPVGTEWNQYNKVYEIDWDFSHLEEAFEEGGILHDKRVWLFGCTEPQMVPLKDGDKEIMKGIHIPAVTAVVATHCPSDKLGVKSVQMVEENIIAMREMKMDWVPFIPEDVADHSSVERFKAQVFVLKCTQRRAALKRMREERLKKYEYCLPYIFNPIKDKDPPVDTTVQVMYPFEDEKQPPIVTEFDWKFDEEEDFLERMETEEGLPKMEREKFWAYCQEQGKVAKAQLLEERAKRKKVIEAIPAEVMDSFRNMKVYKFYPQKSDDAPDIQELESDFINRYYGKADSVFPPPKKKEVGFGFGASLWGVPRADAPKPEAAPEGTAAQEGPEDAKKVETEAPSGAAEPNGQLEGDAEEGQGKGSRKRGKVEKGVGKGKKGKGARGNGEEKREKVSLDSEKEEGGKGEKEQGAEES